MAKSMPEAATVMVIGGGGREHALCWKLSQSAEVKRIYCAPGNGGTQMEPKVENVPIRVDEFEAIAKFARERQVDLTVIGPDNPLADGIVDFLAKEGLCVFGPTKAAAQLEWSKAYAKNFMQRADIPTCRFVVCQSHDEAREAVKKNPWARVVKADGLALGKGVFVCDNEEEVLKALDEIFLKNAFGEAGRLVLLEERLSGEEMSLLYFCDGKTIVAMPPCQDHKRRFDGDTGPNTGGMGAYAPVGAYERCRQLIEDQVTKPLRRALADRLLQFQGIIYAGLMIVEQDGATPGANGRGGSIVPYVLEFNARFGDPETQVLLPLMQSDLYPVLRACTDGTLSDSMLQWSDEAACCVVAVADTYPSSSSKGESITINELPAKAVLFHSGTTSGAEGKGLITNGGRILCATSLAADMGSAQKGAYEALQSVSFKGMDCRKDIAGRAVKSCRSN